jgi:hypothetical protein
MEQTINHIYDKIFKKILTLSSTAVVNLINGLYDTDYPPDSTIRYNWTEFHDDELKRILADTIITINDVHSYHMEAQMTKDDDIVFRVFEYGFAHADRERVKNGDYNELNFPEPRIIYLYSEGKTPDQYTLRVNFGSQGHFDYEVPAFKFLETSVDELNRRKMVILIPFELLRLRKIMQKERTPENLEALKNLIQNDIIGSIEGNLRLGNITEDDARKLKRQTHKLYDHIYAHYNEMEDLNEMTDESLMLDIDIIEKRHEQELAKKDEEIAKSRKVIAEKDEEIACLKKLLEAACSE